MPTPPKTATTTPVPTPLAATLVVAASPALREPRLAGGRLFWLEQRPGEQGRTTLLMQAAGAPPQELTPGRNLRSRVHDYGGGCYAVAGPTVVFSDDSDRGKCSDTHGTGRWRRKTQVSKQRIVEILRQHRPSNPRKFRMQDRFEEPLRGTSMDPQTSRGTRPEPKGTPNLTKGTLP